CIGIACPFLFQDLTHDMQLAGVKHSAKHGLIKGHAGCSACWWCSSPGYYARHAFGGAYFAITIDGGIDADTHVEPGGTIDKVVAATPFDYVAATTTEQDITGVERNGRLQIAASRPIRNQIAEQFTQPCDTVNTSLAEEVVLIEKQFRFVVRVITAVIAAQHIIPVPTRQRLNLVEAITQHLQRLSIKHLLVQIRIASLYIVFVD